VNNAALLSEFLHTLFCYANTLKFIVKNLGFIKLAQMYADVIALVADNS
jgi:hypothetical protein